MRFWRGFLLMPGLALAGALAVGSGGHASASIPIVANPTLVSVRRLSTNPFPGLLNTPVNDAEGLAYDPLRKSLWLADDALGQVLEIDYASGRLLTVVSAGQFALVPSHDPGGPLAGVDRIGDNEGLAYDPDSDAMYLFSGPCCSVHPHQPTAYRFTRRVNGGPLLPESYQPIDDPVHDFSGAAVHNGTIYVSGSKALYTYDYESDAVAGPVANLPFLSGTVTGLGFSADGNDLWVTNTNEDLYRLTVPGFTLIPGYTWDSLKPWGIRDGRAVEVIDDQLVIADGYDGYGSSNPLRHSIYVLRFDGPSPPPTTTPTTTTKPPTTTAAPTTTTKPTTTTTTAAPTTTTKPTTTTVAPTTTTGTPPAPVSPVGAAFVGVTPARLMDTRPAATIDGLAQGIGPLGARGHTRLRVLGRGGVPSSGVGAVALNVTGVDAAADTYLTAWPAGSPQPTASNLNVARSTTVPNMVVVPIGVDGDIEIYNDSGALDVVVDVLGWLPVDRAFHGLSPQRLFDTRDAPTADGRHRGAGPLGPRATTAISVVGRGGVPPTGVGSVALNVTAVGATADSYLTVWPGATNQPLASNVNVARGQTVANMVVVPIGADGTVQVYNDAGRVDVVVDVLGWFAPTSAFTPLPGERLMDTRDSSTIDGLFRHTGPLAGDRATTLRVVGRGDVPETGVGAVVLNVTATASTQTSYVTVWPTGRVKPTASNLNFAPGQTTPNMVIVPVGSDGTITMYNSSGTVELIVDVLGWFPTP